MELKFLKEESYVGAFGHHRQLKLYRIGNYWVKNNTWYNCENDNTLDNCENNRAINLSPIRPLHYTPEIYTEYENGYGKPTGFKIQTTSYGSLDAEEFAEFLKEQNEALEVVKILTEKFVKEV